MYKICLTNLWVITQYFFTFLDLTFLEKEYVYAIQNNIINMMFYMNKTCGKNIRKTLNIYSNIYDLVKCKCISEKLK